MNRTEYNSCIAAHFVRGSEKRCSYCILFYSRLCPSTAGSSPPPKSSHFLCPPRCPTMSSLQRRFGLATDLTPFTCHSVIILVHLLSFIRAMCPAHFRFVLVTYWAMSVTPVLCLTMVLWILSFSLTFRIFIETSQRAMERKCATATGVS